MINHDFLISNKDKLIQIYQKEKFFSNAGKEGALCINFTNIEKVDVFYWTMDQMNEDFRVKLIEEIKKNVENKNIVYLIAFDSDNTNIISYKL